MDKMRRIGSTWSGMEEEQPTHPLDSCTLEHSRESATYDDSHPKVILGFYFLC